MATSEVERELEAARKRRERIEAEEQFRQAALAAKIARCLSWCLTPRLPQLVPNPEIASAGA